MGGGSLPNIPVSDQKFLSDAAKMNVISGGESEKYDMIGNESAGYVVYTRTNDAISISVAPGKYNVYTINKTSGEITPIAKKTAINGKYDIQKPKKEQVYWIEKL